MIHVPLPSWKNLLRILLPTSHSNEKLTTFWSINGKVSGWLSQSAWSLVLISLWRKKYKTESSLIIWIPDYFCNTSLMILRFTGAKFIFYPITEDMSPDIAVCYKLAIDHPPDLFLLVHYFGRSNFSQEISDFCIKLGCWFIEDATHVFRPVKGIGSFGDFVLYSPHKHLPIPDGAVLVVRSSGPSQLSEGQINSFGLPNLWPKQLQKFQEQMGLHRNRHWVRPMIWLIKRILQKLGIRSWRKKSEPFIDASTIKPIQLSQFSEPDLSFLSKRLLGSILLDMEQVSKRRQHNQALWDKVLFQSSISNKIVPAERPIENEWLPYLAAYKTEFSTALEIYEYLESKNFPVTSWPDLPPEVNMNREFHNRAWNLRHTRFYLPIHQSLNEKEIFSLYL